MYLAQEYTQDGELIFYIRETVQESSGALVYRELFELGGDPEKFVEYIDDRVFYISSEVEERLAKLNVKYDYDELEELFWPFIDIELRTTIENFGGLRGRRRGSIPKRGRRMPEDQFQRTHIFDRRRLYYLKFVQIDMDDAVKTPLPIYEMLLEKCRDEIENRIALMELELRPWEIRGYLYGIFNIAAGFAPKLTRFVPDAQDIDLIDKYFLEEMCSLNQDTSWLGVEAREESSADLHPYLQKYLFMFFDTYFSNRGQWKQRGRTSKNQGEWSPPPPSADSDHMKAMGLSEEEFRSMTPHELTSYFRKKALKIHPDKGGDHDKFVAFIEAYQILLARKRWQ